MKKAVLGLLALLLAAPVYAATTAVPLVLEKDVADASFTYCAISSLNTGVGNSRLVTAGSTTTTTAVGGVSVFGALLAGDQLTVQLADGSILTRYVVTPGTTSIVVNSAWDLTGGFAWQYRTYATNPCGTGADSGWLTRPSGALTVAVTVATLNATSIDYSVETRSVPGGRFVQGAASISAAGTAAVTPIGAWTQYRVGLKITGDAGVQSVTVMGTTDTLASGLMGGGAATSVSAAAFPLLAPNGSAAAPSYAFSGAAGTGMFRAAGGGLAFTRGGSEIFADQTAGLNLPSTSQYGVSSGASPSGTAADVGWERQAAGVWGSTNGSTGEGWVQNEAGDQFLTANATNATTTFANLTDLTTTVTSGRKYTFQMYLFCDNTTDSDGIKVDFDGGTATATDFRVNAQMSRGDTGIDVSAAAASSTTLAGVLNVVTLTAQPNIYRFWGSFEPSGSGTFIPRFAGNSAASGTVTIFRGSHLIIKDMP